MRLADLRIRDVWRALGGGPLRHGYGRAFWRDGDGWNVRLYTDSDCFKDFVTGVYGGRLRLVMTALQCDKPSSLQWLTDHMGMDGPSKRTPEEIRAAREAAMASRQSEALRKRLAAQIASAEAAWFHEHHACLQRLLASLRNGALEGEKLERLMNRTDYAEQRYMYFESLLDALRAEPSTSADTWEEKYGID